MVITTETGIKLDSEFGMAAGITEYAEMKGVKNAICFGVNDGEAYLLVVNGKPEFESQKAEDIAVHVDILAIGMEKLK